MLRRNYFISLVVALFILSTASVYAGDDKPLTTDDRARAVLIRYPNSNATNIPSPYYGGGTVEYCNLYSYDPTIDILDIIGTGFQDCVNAIQQTLKVCIYVKRWWGWANLGCNQETTTRSSLLVSKEVLCESGTHTYQTRANGSFVGVSGKSYSSPTANSFHYTQTC
jgi:hypothetical protein